ncbi:LADA_0C11452g1_1 [Lachancea dasiensis]|uniref:non-specific serine/threonine protein kinase n=1 Tax=Lachancea dasiensis TaxID=1072105 RepID=A0A1G4J1F3_9SACH|nr:LADA_0C11452g1_1 [Lachancea dasiensis]
MDVSSLSSEESTGKLSKSGSASPDSTQSRKTFPSSPSGSTLSYDEYLKVATDTSASILLELNMDGRVRYLSSIWKEIVGIESNEVVGQMISEILVGSEQDRSVFQRATDLMIAQDCSYRVRFLVEAGHPNDSTSSSTDLSGTEHPDVSAVNPSVIELEAQGIVIFDGVHKIPSHSMWIVKPFCELGAMDNLPQDLVKRLGFGAIILSQYLTEIENSMVTDELELPTPKNELCRVCESSVPAWWLETHSESCIVEHKIESMVQLFHDKIVERRNYIEDVFVSLESNDGRISHFKNLPFPKLSAEPSAYNSESTSKSDSLELSIFKKTSSGQKNSSSIFRSLRFPFKTLASLIELCDDAINTNTSELREVNLQQDISAQVVYQFSPRTLQNIDSVLLWKPQTDGDNLAIDALKNDTMEFASQKLEFLFRLDHAMKYSFKIKNEIDYYVLQLIEEKLERNRLNSLQSDEANRHMTRSPLALSLTGNDLKLSTNKKIASPQPQRAPSGIFADAYVGTDELPQKKIYDLNSEHPEFPEGTTTITHGSRSVTPTTTTAPHSDLHIATKGSSSDQSKLFESVSATPKLILPDSSGQLRLSGQESTPRRNSAGSSAGHSTPLASLQKNSIIRSLNHGSLDRSPRTSPYAPSSELLTPEVHSASIPKQPLSPLLLATNQAKPSTPSIRDYDIIKPISKGAYGSVFLAKRRLTGEYYAIKALKKSDMIAKNQVTNVKSERAIMMAQSNKPYVAQLFATFQNRENLFLVMEYLSGGDLATLIKMMGSLPDQWAKQYITEVIYGVADMHKSGIIHHDLKPDNLLIDRRGHLKLTDFGLSRMGLITRHTGATLKEGHHTSRKNSVASEENTGDRSLKWHLKDDPPGSSNALDGIIFKRERSSSNSSSQSALDASALHRSGSQLSFSMMDLHSGGSPPPMSLHKRTASNISESWDNHSPTPDYALFNPDDSNQNRGFFGTPDYLAPETIGGTGETDACDWWSVGCMLFEFFFGYPPFHAQTVEEVFSNILAGRIDWPEFPDKQTELEYITPDAKDLIKKLLVIDPHERLGASDVQEIFEHPYFKDVVWENLYDETGSFVPDIQHPESTDYFDLRGAQLEDFTESDTEKPKIPDLLSNEMERSHKRTSSERSSQSSTPVQKLTVGSVLESVQHQSCSNNSSPSTKHIPLAIPLHLRERRVSKLNEVQTEFGSFNFRNLPALDRANKDAINRLKNEHLVEQGMHHHHHHQRASSGSSSLSDSSKQLRYSTVSSSPGVASLTSRSSASPNASKNHSPNRRGSVDMSSMSHRRSTGIFMDHSPKSPSSAVEDNDSPSPASRFKSPLSPQNTSSRTRVHSRSSSKHSSLGDVPPEEFEKLRALSRVAGSRGRRRSGRESSSAASELYCNLDILVCEPIPIHRFKLTKDLENLGCSVISVSMGDEMVRRVTSGVQFDILFTALKLPKLGAIDIVKLLRNTNSVNSATPIIAVTAFYQEAQQAGIFDDVLERPVSVEHLRSLLLKYTLKKSQRADETVISDADTDLV